MRIIPDSEFIINPDGSAFHLHVKPEQLSDKIVMMGDPDRVTMTASFFDSIECDVRSREFHTVTGMYKGKRLTALSHGIGTDNIDIVVTELDALANIDFHSRTVKPEFRQLTMIRVGTSGGMQPHCPIGSYVVSEKSIGFDGLLHYYAHSQEVREEDFEEAFQKHVNWSPYHCSPYVVSADEELVERIGWPARPTREASPRRPRIECKNRIVPLRRALHHQLRNGKFGHCRIGQNDGTQVHDRLRHYCQPGSIGIQCQL